MVIQELTVGGRRCCLAGDGDAVFLRGFFVRDERETEELCAALEKALPEGGWTLFDYECTDWDADFSPWSADTAGEHFPGGGTETLRFLREEALPLLRTLRPEGRFFTAGYSLSALFALWAFCECPLFSGAVCCSGSLWYPGWAEYADAHPLREGSAVYLSLGGKEPGKGRPPMNTVGEAYERQSRLCKAAPGVRSTYVMNPGGHFADSNARLAKGFRWILGQGSAK